MQKHLPGMQQCALIVAPIVVVVAVIALGVLVVNKISARHRQSETASSLVGAALKSATSHRVAWA